MTSENCEKCCHGTGHHNHKRLMDLDNPRKVRLLQETAFYGTKGKVGDVVEFVYKNAVDSMFWYGRNQDGEGVAIPLSTVVEEV